ncbi:recombinase family protein [Actinomadura yumaensis]|uniref:recombinase family protein n=1 Tax=Actinomadura yumaensis TaxID=111807 RepID=UPI00360B2833
MVKWIFAQFIGGRGIFDIAEDLTRQGVPSPSAADPTRNRHRVQIAWSKSAVRVIITNPRYTGRQVWNKQRKDEVLLDVDDVALGHTTKLRWNDRDQWVWSERQAHQPLVSVEDFQRAQAVLARRGHGPATHKPHRTRRPYAFRGCLLCGYCDRRMQGNWNNDQAYSRCRFPAEYALANKIAHPKVVYLREAEIIGDIDAWLTTAFSPARIKSTIEAMTEQADDAENTAITQLRKRLATCDQRLSQYRAALNAGADAVHVATWINETEQERARLECELGSVPPSHKVSSHGLEELLNWTGELAHAVVHAHPQDKAQLYTELGLTMTYYPEKNRGSQGGPGFHMCKWFVSEGDLNPHAP